MCSRPALFWLLALLLFLAGPLSASASAAPAQEAPPCHDMAEGEGHDMVESHDTAAADGEHNPSHPDTAGTGHGAECQCCPGSCSSAAALGGEFSAWPSRAARPSASPVTRPHRLPATMLRPPIQA